MTYRKLLIPVATAISFGLLCGGPSYAQLWSGILSAGRATDWTQAGVVGGIPTNRTQCVTSACATVTTNGASSTQAQIQAAIASAPANTYVLLPAGQYSLPGICMSGVNNVTLRGAGANQTFIVTTGTSGCGGTTASMSISSSDGNNRDHINNGPVAVSGSVSQGSTTITLASVPNLKVGNPIILDQQDSATDNGGILVLNTGSSYTGPYTAPGNAGPYSIDGGSGATGARCAGTTTPVGCFSQQQIVIVTTCNGVTTVGSACSGTNVAIGFSPPLNMPNWSTSDSMSAWWGTAPVQYDGFEDFYLDSTSGVSGSEVGIELNNCSNCWVKGVTSINTPQAHVNLELGTHDSIVNSYFFLTQNHETSSYGIQCIAASSFLIENDIFHAVASPIIWSGSCSGGVVGYNFAINNYYTESATYNQNFHGDHDAGEDTILLEGNIGNYIDADNIHGTADSNTSFRNVLTGPQAYCYASGSTYATSTYGPCDSGLSPVEILSYHRFYNVIGNVLGTTGVNTAYNPGTSSNSNVYAVGYGDGVPDDPNVQATLMLWGNADSATGFASPRFNCSEVPTALTGSQAFGLNPCPSSHTLPPSFYYGSQPSWWPSGKPWPIIGPDITAGNISICSSGTYVRSLVTSTSMCTGGTGSTGMNGLANSNPAMDCYFSLGGLPSGTGPALSFNESSCYGQTVSSNPPQPPTNLTATVQ